MGDTRDKNAGSPPPPALPPPCPHPDPEGEQGVSCPFPVVLSCGIWAIQASPLKTLIQRQRGGGRSGAIFTSRCPSAAKSALPSFPWAPVSALAMLSGTAPGCVSLSSVLAFEPEARDRVCMCRMWLFVYMACVCRTVYIHAACTQGCLHMCKCTCVRRILCVTARVYMNMQECASAKTLL